MSATIDINGVRATVRDGVWTSKDADLARQCEASADLEFHGYAPNPDYSAAGRAPRAFGGRVVRYTPTPPTIGAVLY